MERGRTRTKIRRPRIGKMAIDKPNVKAEIENYARFQKFLESAIKRVGDLSPAFNSIANDWLKNNRQIFKLKSKGQYQDLSTKPFVAFWESDKRFRKFWEGGYKEFKRAKYGFDYPILKRTGRLEASMTDRNSPDSVIVIDATALVMGTNVEYGVYHQSLAPRKKIPYRPFIITKEGIKTGGKYDTWQKQKRRFVRIIRTYVQRQLKKSI